MANRSTNPPVAEIAQFVAQRRSWFMFEGVVF
jgi:hypothetical protein